MRNSFRIIIAVALLLSGRSATAESGEGIGLQRSVDSLLSCWSLRTAVTGVFAVTVDGDTLVDVRRSVNMVPASNMKLLTTAAALSVLGPEFRFPTDIRCSGTVTDGVLDGDVYICGGGDPSTGDAYEKTLPADSLFAVWKMFLETEGIRSIRGRIIGDPRYFDGEDVNDEWSVSDTGFDYGASVTGLNFFGNIQKFNITVPSDQGSPVRFSPEYPETPWMAYVSKAYSAGKDRHCDGIRYEPGTVSPIGVLRGSCSGSARPYSSFSNSYGALTCAYYFYRYLICNGIVAEGYADVLKCGKIRDDFKSEPVRAAADSLRLLGSTFSRPLAELSREANVHSDNFYVEAFYRTVGKKLTGSASLPQSAEAMSGLLTSLTGKESFNVADGCGLSRKNSISPELIVSALRSMTHSSAFPEYFASLPAPGEGTLGSRFRNESDEFKSRIRMKSGSMGGVLCFSGYILPRTPSGKMIAFSVLANNYTVKPVLAYAALEELITLLAAGN